MEQATGSVHSGGSPSQAKHVWPVWLFVLYASLALVMVYAGWALMVQPEDSGLHWCLCQTCVLSAVHGATRMKPVNERTIRRHHSNLEDVLSVGPKSLPGSTSFPAYKQFGADLLARHQQNATTALLYEGNVVPIVNWVDGLMYWTVIS
jgi:hypothetical protein